MEQKEEVKKNGPLNLDFELLLPRHDDGDGDEEPPLPVVATTIVDDDDEAEQKKLREDLRKLSDRELEEAIVKFNRTLKLLRGTLPDGGLKVRANIERHQYEIDRRRRLRQLAKEDYGCEKLMELKGPQFTSASDGVRREASVPASQSLFTACFSKKLDGKNTDSRTVNAFESEFSVLGRCDRGKRQYKGKFSPKEQPLTSLSSRQSPFRCPTTLSVDGDKPVHLKNHQNGGLNTKKRKLSQDTSSNNVRPRNGKAVVLVDEEEAELSESMEPADQRMKASTIYYPSSDDPESIEICGSDMECLKPQAYLSSTIMNFYIRYLQQDSPTRARCDYHFFNTYFYNKLKEAVVKKNDHEDFIKFRRWWKGVDIFHKAYVLLPIHETVHWSLVIICIPDKEDESGPIVLHLDSLGLHSSKQIFANIKSFLRQEWEYLNREEASSDLSIAERNRKKLRLEEKTVSVPQQKNDSDCGLFVLYFMERFINLAPQRLKKKDLAMFTNKWFKPEEASSMRRKVLNILQNEFRNAIATGQNCVLDQDPLSSVGPQEQRFGQTIDC